VYVYVGWSVCTCVRVYVCMGVWVMWVCVVCGVWCVVCGVWCMVYGVWRVARRVWCMIEWFCDRVVFGCVVVWLCGRVDACIIHKQ